MTKELLDELIEETQMTDIAEKYFNVVEIIGIRKFVELSNYARGEELYFPKLETVIGPARNRRIKKEFNGSNGKELAEKYNITMRQLWNVLKDAPPVGQMSLEEWFAELEATGTEHPV